MYLKAESFHFNLFKIKSTIKHKYEYINLNIICFIVNGKILSFCVSDDSLDW